ncbi:ankyrin [Lentithecium fluviatile CBS 122367]|uniref:Ankyrin n=1 Tax=Lentithecium fluviatile CBS 122367 TaxID=1168545 RepID=A0A6G1ISG7_9PLEO|nr:ankyrin [Lentithecium fluviatile CBS 122367]
MESSYDLVIHENYGVSLAPENSVQKSTKAPRIENVAGIVSLALGLGVPVLGESGNASLERTDLAAGVSSRASVFKLQPELIGLNENESSYTGKLVVSKHLAKGYVEDESHRYDALVRDLLFLSHDPIRTHENFVKIIAIGWEDLESPTHDRIWPVLVLQFAEYGTLEDFFQLDDTDKSWNSKRSICCDIAAALDWLHKCRIMHSDVKFGNVLVSANANADASAPSVAKLSDFGFALDIDVLEQCGQDTARLEGFTQPCAPEADSSIPLSLLTKFDVFSYGLLAVRVFLNGDKLAGDVCSPANFSGKVLRSCAKLGLYDEKQLRTIENLVASTTSVAPEHRVDMNDALLMISTGSIGEPSTKTNDAAPVEFDDDLLSAVPEIEDIWALGIFPKARKTIVDDLVKAVENAEFEAEDESSPVTAKIMYELYLAHLVGFGCKRSEKKALDYLYTSARLGFRDAQKAVYATYSALSVAIPSARHADFRQWLTQEAFLGDKACLQELQAFDEEAYREGLASKAHRRALCERSLFAFDNDFMESHDVSDVENLIFEIQTYGDAIDEDIGGGLTWLHYAVFMDSLGLATRLLVDFDFPVDVTNCRGQTPLWLACLSGNYEMATLLLSHNADANITSSSGLNCLHHLVAFDDEYVAEVARLLQAHGAQVNEQNEAGLTPLHYAIRGSGALREEPCVATLLELDADPLIRDEDGDTPLDTAIYTMRVSYLERFLASKPMSNIPTEALKETLANAFGNWIRQMKQYRLHSGSTRYRERLATLTQLLHTDGINQTYIANHPAGFTPLHDAYAWSSDDIGTEIIKQPNVKLDELDAREYGYTPLMIAIRTSTIPVIEQLIHAGADPLIRARTGENVLHHCVQYNPSLLPHICSQIETRHGNLASICNQQSFKKAETPLDYALLFSDADTARFLLSKGANPNIKKESHEDRGLAVNSLRACLVPPNVRMLELLLPYMETGAFVCCENGMNLLHLACMHVPDEAKPGDNTLASFINAIVDYFPAGIDAPGGFSAKTPLHFAAMYGNVTAVKVLLRHGADPWVRDKMGSRPVDDVDDDGELVDVNGNEVVGIVRQRLLRRWRETRVVLREAMQSSGRGIDGEETA